MAVDATGGALNAAVNQLTLEDASKDMASNKGKVNQASSERKDLNKRIEESEKKAEEAKQKAKDLEDEANGAGFFKKIIGQKAALARDAAEAGHQVETLRNQAQATELEMKAKGSDMETALEKLQNGLQALEQGKQDVDQFQSKDSETFDATQKILK